MSPLPSLCAVIVTYNRADKLRRTLQAYLNTPVQKIVVVDNASTDQTSDCLKEFLKLGAGRLVVVRLACNTGGAGGFYYGLKFVKDTLDCDWVVLSDDDSYPASGTIASFLDGVRHEGAQNSIVASKVIFPTGEPCKMNLPMEYIKLPSLFRNLIRGRSLTSAPPSLNSSGEPRSVMASSFVGMFISLDMLHSSNVMPRRDYFLYWDDISFCFDMRAAGADVKFYPHLLFYHDCSRSSGILTGERFYYFVRNGFRVIRKLPTPLRYAVAALKGTVWFFLSVRQNGFSYFRKALRDI